MANTCAPAIAATSGVAKYAPEAASVSTDRPRSSSSYSPTTLPTRRSTRGSCSEDMILARRPIGGGLRRIPLVDLQRPSVPDAVVDALPHLPDRLRRVEALDIRAPLLAEPRP